MKPFQFRHQPTHAKIYLLMSLGWLALFLFRLPLAIEDPKFHGIHVTYTLIMALLSGAKGYLSFQPVITLDESGIHLHYGFRKEKSLAWNQFTRAYWSYDNRKDRYRAVLLASVPLEWNFLQKRLNGLQVINKSRNITTLLLRPHFLKKGKNQEDLHWFLAQYIENIEC